MSSTSTARARVRSAAPGPRLAARIRGWFTPTPAPELGAWREHRRIGTPIAVVAYGDAFEFQIHASLMWQATSMEMESFRAQVDRATPQVLATLRQRAAKLARGHLPHRAGDFEDELNREFGNHTWTFARPPGALTCRAQVVVLPDDKVRASLQPIWNRRVTMESEYDLALRRAELVGQVTEVWTATIEKLQNNPLTAHAAKLTEDPFAKVFGDMLSERGAAARDLIHLLREAIRDHQKVGLYEFTEAYDAALKAYEKQAGLSSPDQYAYEAPPEDPPVDE